MKILMTAVVAAIVAAGFSLAAAPEAEAGGCGAAYGCSAQVLVPTPQPIPLRRRWRRPRVAAAPCVAPCVARPAVVAPAAPCVAPCGVPAPRAYYYRSPNYYANYTQPAYAGGCNLGPGNCYWRRNCWYDSFGRRFCN
ncbi:MAG: hypothetical protein QNJ62_05375 [Methyloceanibacter sp.]|nr:hypothetical protein [Methyloceanibacter sp.]